MRIDQSESADGPEEPDAAGRDRSKSADSSTALSLAHSGSASRTELSAAYRIKVDTTNRQYKFEQGNAGAEEVEYEGAATGLRRVEVAEPRAETFHAPGGDFPDDPRNYSNPKTGRFDASWSVYDRAIAAAREHAGGDLGPDSIKMYDYNAQAQEGTGTLIGEQTSDRLRGWRMDGQDGHVNWWDWTGGKKGSGGLYGHDWFPEDASVPGSRYIGWAPWQDSNGRILEGN